MNGVQGNESSESIRSPGRALPGQVVLVLQGGGALGSYQAGVYQALHEAGIEPDWVIGTSIGAINASLIAGNVPQNRVSRLQEFWKRVEQRPIWSFPGAFPGINEMLSYWSTVANGIPVSSDPIRSLMPARTVRSVPIAPDITPQNRSSRRLANSSISIW
jgi:NTE family protein